MPQDLHVAIIGAGLGGLCLAQGLRRIGVDVTVFERDASPESRGQGYRIRIDAADGQDALRQTLPTALNTLFRQTCAAAVTTGRFLDTRLNEISGRPVETWRPSTTIENDDASQTDRTANRQTLRQILMSGIEPHVRFGKALQSFEQAAQGVRCRFDDGSTVRADLLVAADGASSTIRRALLPGSEPHDTGDVNIYGKTVMTPDHVAAVGSVITNGISVVFDETFVVVIDAIRFRAPLPQLAARFAPHCPLTPVDDYLYWSFFGARPSLGLPAGHLRLGSPPDVHGHVRTLDLHLAPRPESIVPTCRSRRSRHAPRLERTPSDHRSSGADRFHGGCNPRHEPGWRSGREHCVARRGEVDGEHRCRRGRERQPPGGACRIPYRYDHAG